MEKINNVLLNLLNNNFNILCNNICKLKSIEMSIEERDIIWKNIINSQGTLGSHPLGSNTLGSHPLGSDKTGCIHKLLKGNVGNVCCKPICRKSITKKYCRLHVKFENTEGSVDSDEPITSDVKIIETAIKKSTYGNFIHTKTKLVFDPKTKTVIGKEADKGIVNPLSSLDLELCKTFRFKLHEHCKIIN